MMPVFGWCPTFKAQGLWSLFRIEGREPVCKGCFPLVVGLSQLGILLQNSRKLLLCSPYGFKVNRLLPGHSGFLLRCWLA
jgi:hypothetical protein